MTASLRLQVSVSLLFSTILVGKAVAQKLEPLSVTSLSLKILHNETDIGGATGFVLEKNHKPYLVTNRHVVLACSLDPGPSNVGGWICANRLRILQNQREHLGAWFWVTEELLDEQGKQRWLEHPTLHGGADVVALPLSRTENVQFYPLDIEQLGKADFVVSPGESVSIVGFPFGLGQAAGLPVWKTGTVASDLDVDFQGKPVFLADTTSRPGMSGSPVYALRSGIIHTSTGTILSGGTVTKFLGVYSEQIPAAEIGGVWKAGVVTALYDSLP